jgi:phage gpG-like protein
MAIRRIGPGFEFKKTLQKFQQVKQQAPKVIAENSKNHFIEGFRKGGGQTDDSKTGWEPRKSTAKRNAGRAILVDTGALRRSITVLKATWKEIIIGTQRIKYAERHNEGLKGMPKREFIGDSEEMNKENKKLLEKLISKVFK